MPRLPVFALLGPAALAALAVAVVPAAGQRTASTPSGPASPVPGARAPSSPSMSAMAKVTAPFCSAHADGFFCADAKLLAHCSGGKMVDSEACTVGCDAKTNACTSPGVGKDAVENGLR